jgi:hypothetical protein
MKTSLSAAMLVAFLDLGAAKGLRRQQSSLRHLWRGLCLEEVGS